MTDRFGKCYELRLGAMTGAGPNGGLVLVHRTVDGGPLLNHIQMAHAWTETSNGKVFDPVLSVILPTQEYYARHRAVAVQRYSYEQAMRLAGASRRRAPRRRPSRRPAPRRRRLSTSATLRVASMFPVGHGAPCGSPRHACAPARGRAEELRRSRRGPCAPPAAASLS